ncbi:MAG: hypothetical protein EAZ55_00975 [Cytophagales bacterium]|nr:MAG: hypothetical protein EAZ55_00975 [Cytophagales bacterium]
MKFRVIINAIFIFTFIQQVHGQMVKTYGQHKSWIDSICKLDFDQKLNALREKILLDTNSQNEIIRVRDYYSSSATYKDSSNVKVLGTPTYVFDGIPLYFENDIFNNNGISDKNLIEFITTYLTSENIRKIDCPNCYLGDEIYSLWATRAIFGVFLFSTKYNPKNEYLKTSFFEYKTRKAVFKNKFGFIISPLTNNIIKIDIEKPFSNTVIHLFTGKLDKMTDFSVKTHNEMGDFIILRIEVNNEINRLLILRER